MTKATKKNVSALYKEAEVMIEHAKKIPQNYKMYKWLIRDAYRALRKKQAEKCLKEISIDELSEDLPGTRIKILRENGVCSYADVYERHGAHISLLKGVSNKKSVEIYKAVENRLNMIARNTPVRISVDDRFSREATSLVRLVITYMKGLSIAQRCIELLNTFNTSLQQQMVSVQPILKKNKIEWFFANKETKVQVQKSFDLLLEMLNGDFGTGMTELFAEHSILCKYSDKQFWDAYVENPHAFNVALELYCGDL